MDVNVSDEQMDALEGARPLRQRLECGVEHWRRSIPAMTCPTCKGERWVCEEHGGERGHTICLDKNYVPVICKSACDPCPTCNTGSPPEMPPDFTVIDDSNIAIDKAWGRFKAAMKRERG